MLKWFWKIKGFGRSKISEFDEGYALADNRELASAVQQGLISLGYDLGNSGADGVWGAMSANALDSWKATNRLSDQDVDTYHEISPRQFELLEQQAADPSLFNDVKQASFYNNFDSNALSHLDPVRAALLEQAASHVGVVESQFTVDKSGNLEGNNAGRDIKEYLEGYGVDEGNAWCAAYGGWVFDQVKEAAGVGEKDFLRGSPSVEGLLANVMEDAPQAVKSLRDYEPQGGDIMLLRYGNGQGHFMMVASSESLEDGNAVYSDVTTVEGNYFDSVGVGLRSIYTDSETGKSHPIIVSEDENIEVYDQYEVVVIDISELPGYDAMNKELAAAGDFKPTASVDPHFMLDEDGVYSLQTALFNEQDRRAATPEQAPVEPDIPERGRSPIPEYGAPVSAFGPM